MEDKLNRKRKKSEKKSQQMLLDLHYDLTRFICRVLGRISIALRLLLFSSACEMARY